jgi:hypothetical protein
VDLVRGGFTPRVGAVWFYKLDFTTNLDPSIVRQLPSGWRAFDYVVSSEIVRSALAQNPSSLEQVRDALSHSTAIATFGRGARRVEIRRLTGPGQGSGLVPQAEPDAPPAVAVAAPPRPAQPAPHPPRARRRATHHRGHHGKRHGRRR